MFTLAPQPMQAEHIGERVLIAQEEALGGVAAVIAEHVGVPELGGDCGGRRRGGCGQGELWVLAP